MIGNFPRDLRHERYGNRRAFVSHFQHWQIAIHIFPDQDPRRWILLYIFERRAALKCIALYSYLGIHRLRHVGCWIYNSDGDGAGCMYEGADHQSPIVRSRTKMNTKRFMDSSLFSYILRLKRDREERYW